MEKPEILAPVGNSDMLFAGIAAGADSFYLALDDFGARAYAENFTLENIKETIDYIHLFERRVFITLNTLIKDHEMPKAISYVEKLYEYGVDGFIIQDLGFFSVIKNQVPGMELHSSTQMAVREYFGAKYLADLGFDRIVIARETPIEEIRKIASLPVETEVFVHGSLCVSFSGECLMSSYFGGRSANRGRCAGPCRQKYKLISNEKILGDDYYLNMKDLNAIDNLDQLLEIGVDCLKIEGRMKTPEYVFSAVSNYKNKIENDSYNKNEMLDSSNRGYTKGFIFGQNKDYISLKDDNKHRSVGKVIDSKNKKYFITNSILYIGDNLEILTEKGKKLPFTTTRDYQAGEKILLKKYPDAKVDSDVLIVNSSKLAKDKDQALSNYRNLPVNIYFKARLGEKPQIKLEYKNVSATYIHNVIIEQAKNIAISETDIRENLSKFNDEIFTPDQINIEIDDELFLRKKDINECRRMGVAALKEAILNNYHRNEIKIDLPNLEKNQNQIEEKNIELLSNDISPELLTDFDNIYIRNFNPKYAGHNLYLNLDSHDEYEINSLIDFIKENKIKGVVCNNYRDLSFIHKFKENDIKIRIGRSLNIFNSYTADFYKAFAENICVSTEIDLDILNNISKNQAVEALVYGRPELMNMRHCPFSVIKKCGLSGCKTCRFNKAGLESHDGDKMKVIRYGEYSKIYPDQASIFIHDDFSDNVSLLYSVMDDNDILNMNQAKIRDSYTKGVI